MPVVARGPSPVWFWVNTVGSLVDDTYYAFFLQNVLPYNFQTVYQDPAGLVAWSNPIEFGPNAGLPDNIFFDESLVYRIEIRKGPLQTDPLVGNPIENYQVLPGSGQASDTLLTSGNIIVDPQFVDILFTSPLTYTQASPSTYTVPIAPGWNLLLTGAGTIVVTQGFNDGASGDPATYLEFNSSGWTTVQLQQTFTNNGAIFAGGAVAIAFSAVSISTAQNISAFYIPSTGSSVQLYPVTSIPTGNFQSYQNAVNIPASTNTQLDGSASVTISFTLPNSGIIELSNIQITGQSVPLSSAVMANPMVLAPIYQEQTYQTMLNNEFNYWQPLLAQKPIPSYLVGWDFSLNPAQATGYTITAQAIGNNKSYYTWDQTIVFQSNTSGFTIGQGTDGSFELSSAVNDVQGALIQYIPENKARELLNRPMAVNICGYTDTPSTLGIVITLWWTTNGSLPSVGSGNSVVASLDANGIPTAQSGWSKVPTQNGQDNTIILGTQSNPVNQYMLNGWNLGSNNGADTATWFAIVVSTKAMPTAQTAYFRSISLCQGNIATIPAPQTADEVLRECQLYYEKSYDSGVLPETETLLGSVLSEQTFNQQFDPTQVGLVSRSIYLPFNTAKFNATPVITVYSPVTGTANFVHGYLRDAATALSDADIEFSTNWTSGFDGQKSHGWIPSNTNNLVGLTVNTNAFPEAYILFHFTADCRLGV